jgi:uncharacterized membrane protein YedE/YeeE
MAGFLAYRVADDAVPYLIHDRRLAALVAAAVLALALVCFLISIWLAAASAGQQRVDASTSRFRRRRPRTPDH